MSNATATVSLSDAINELPSLSPVLAKLATTIANAHSSADDMEKVLRLDPVLAGRILRLANSAYVGLPRSIASLKKAVVLLGQKRIYSLAITSGILSASKPLNELPFSLAQFWRHSLSTALVAESIAKYLKRYIPIDSDEAFTAGLLHDVGKVIMGCYQKNLLEAALKRSQKEKVPFYLAETSEASHVFAAGMLAEHWNFPVDLIDVLMHHHTPENITHKNPLVCVIHIADIMVHVMGFTTFPGEIPPKLNDFALSAIKMQPEHLGVIATESMQNEKSIEAFINFFL